MVSSLFSIKAAHWRDGIEFGTDREGKSGGARRRVIRVKGSASRGEGSSTRMSTRKNADARFALSVNCYRPRKRLRLTRRGIEYEHEHEHEHEHKHEHEHEQEQEQEGPNVSRTAHHPLSGKRERLPDNGISDGRSILRHALCSVLRPMLRHDQVMRRSSWSCCKWG